MKYLISLSGGLDSCVLLARLKREEQNEVIGVSFTYGSKHNQFENEAARKIAEFYGIELIEIDITSMMSAFKSNLLLSGGNIPEGHYEEESMKATVVPARNMIFLSILTGIAISREINHLMIGVHSGDHAIYPDCRPTFIDNMGKSIFYASDSSVILYAPYLNQSKSQIVETGLQYNAPLHLTRTCYKNQPIARGKCGSCIERLISFHKNKYIDPIKYEDRNAFKNLLDKNE